MTAHRSLVCHKCGHAYPAANVHHCPTHVFPYPMSMKRNLT